MTNPLTPPPMTDAAQNPIKKPLTLRLADRLSEGITTGPDWPNTNDELLRLQSAHELRRLEARVAQMHAALVIAREFISTDRNALADASMAPDGSMDEDDAAAVGDYDAALVQIDAAMQGEPK